MCCEEFVFILSFFSLVSYLLNWIDKIVSEPFNIACTTECIDSHFKDGYSAKYSIKMKSHEFWGFSVYHAEISVFYMNTTDSPWNAKCNTNARQRVVSHIRRYLQVVYVENKK